MQRIAKALSLTLSGLLIFFVAAWPLRADLIDGGMAAGRNILPPVVVAGAYPISLQDCFRPLIQAGTGQTPQATITLPPSTAVPPGCRIRVKNGDVWSGIGTGHARTLANFPADLKTFLWPSQVTEVIATSAGWQTAVSPGRWLLPGLGNVVEICVTQNDNNANDGLSAGTNCMATLQNAVNVIGTQWDGGGYNSCAIGVYSGGTNTINESVSQTGQSIGCYLTVNWHNNGITWTNTGPCWAAGDGSIIIMNFTPGTPTIACNTSNTANSGQFTAHQSTIYDFFGSLQWNPAGSNDTFMYADAYGRATLGLTTMVVGPGTAVSANSIMNCNSMCLGLQISGTVAFSANVTLAASYVIRNGGYINTTASYTGSPTVGSASTPTGNARLITNGTGASIPGGTTPTSSGNPAQNTFFGLVCSTASVC